MKNTYTKIAMRIFSISLAAGLAVFIHPLQAQNKWGGTFEGGFEDCGSLFQTDANGKLISVFKFPAFQGSNPYLTRPVEASAGHFYGLTFGSGSPYYGGILYEYDMTKDSFITHVNFKGPNGKTPQGSMIKAANGKLYGMTFGGGATNDGIIFEFNPTTKTVTKLMDFNNATSGANPSGALFEASNGRLYGMTSKGGTMNAGVLFYFDINTNTYTKIGSFDATNGAYPSGELIEYKGKLYGVTNQGGAFNGGVLFEFNIANSAFRKIHSFSASKNGVTPRDLCVGWDGNIYGNAQGGGTKSKGTIFKYNLGLDSVTKVLEFDGATMGESPNRIIMGTDSLLYGTCTYGGAGWGTAYSFNIKTSGYTKLFEFTVNNGSIPLGGFMQAQNGKLYTTPFQGGTRAVGVFLEYDIKTAQNKVLFSFAQAPLGRRPYGTLTQINAYTFLGIATAGGKIDKGTLFQFSTKDSTIKVLHHFEQSTGMSPYCPLMQLKNTKKLLGTTTAGGANNQGVIFEWDYSTNTYTKLADLGTSTGIVSPYTGLVEAANGKIYGCVNSLGKFGAGGIFEFDLNSKSLSIKYDFSDSMGAYNQYGMYLANNNKLYGTTSSGGINDEGVLFEFDPANYAYKKLVEFDYATTGSSPEAGVMQASNGKLYGITNSGGANNNGVIFEYDLALSKYKKLADFVDSTTGDGPSGRLIQSSNGNLYGCTSYGGKHDYGSVFEFNIGTGKLINTTSMQYLNGSRLDNVQLMEYNPIYLSQKSIEKVSGILYPNPTTGMLNLRLDEPVKQIRVFDMEGNLKQTYGSVQTINLTELKSGIYMVRITLQSGKATGKMVSKI